MVAALAEVFGEVWLLRAEIKYLREKDAMQTERIATLCEANRQKQALIEHINTKLDGLIAKCEEA